MPMLKPIPSDEEESVYVSIFTHIRDDLPVKEWEVEMEKNLTVADLKQQIFADYNVEPDLQRLCVANMSADPGIRDTWCISDLPNLHESADVKKICLLPVLDKAKEAKLLVRVLDWANRAECLEEYEAQGCVFVKADDGTGRKSMRNSIADMGPKAMGKLSDMRRKSRGSAAGKPKLEIDGDKLEMQEPLPPLVERLPFNLWCGVVAAGNVFVVGLEADYTCWGLGIERCPVSDRVMWFALDAVFALLFMGEVVLRIAQLGICNYVLGDPSSKQGVAKFMNACDFFIVILRFFDTFAFDLLAGVDTKIKIISCLRIMQFARVAKLMRLVRAVRELWLIVAGIIDLGKTVMWVMILLVIIFWVLGIVLTIIIGHDEVAPFDYMRSDWGKSQYFDTVPKSAFSLFQIMTLSQWSTIIIRPIFGEMPSIILIIIPFLCITTVGLLNIIVGVVVETTLTSASHNKEREDKEEQKMHARVMESLKMVFEEADTDGGGTLDKQELRKSLKKPHVRDRLRVLDIPVKDLDQLFDVLDEAGLGEISTEHFFRGCSRLRGPALACDLHRMSVDFTRYITWTSDLLNNTVTATDMLRRLLHDIESIDRDIIRGEADDCDPVLGSRRDRSIAKEKKENDASRKAEAQNARKASKASAASRGSRPSLMARTLTTGNLGGN